MNRNEVEQALRMARAYVAERLPWFAPALYVARFVLTEACPFAAAMDEGMRVYFNPRKIAALLTKKGPLTAAMPELGWLWYHEIAHGLREHGPRARERNAQPEAWNIAGDLEINDAQLSELTPPPPFAPLLPGTFHLPEGKLAEFYYDRLLEENQQQSQPLTRPDEGSGVHGEKRSWELPDGSPDAPALSEVDQAVVRRTVAEEIQRQKTQGSMPAGWVRWADEVLTPKVDWREVLKRRVRGAIVTGTGQRVDYSFHRPHRRTSAYTPFLPPSLHGDFLPRVACVVDTSGSISEPELAQALAEVRAVLESLRAPITIIPCDAVPYEPVKIFTQSDFLTLCHTLPGGGGTNMVAGIEAAVKLQPTPDTVIVLTDGYTPFPTQRYKAPVIFGIFDPGDAGDIPEPPMPPWRKDDVVIIPCGH
jgi:predicted metal-dependent peptidase